MSKKLLILETSVTLQKLFTTTLDSDDYTIQFVNDGKTAIYALFENPCDVFLVNCDIQNPSGFEIVRIVRSMKCFKDLTIGMYASFPTPLDEEFAKDSGATSFVLLDQKTLVLNIDELAQLSGQRADKLSLLQIKKNIDDSYLFMQSANLMAKVSYKNALYANLSKLIMNLENIEEMVKTLLLLITEVCEVPVA